MATLTLEIPDDMLQEAQARLAGRGHTALEDFILSAVQALAQDGEPIDAETEALLLEGLESPAVEMTREDWDEKLQRFEQRHQGKSRT